jgi:cysteinyl-tRNA synthetase
MLTVRTFLPIAIVMSAVVGCESPTADAQTKAERAQREAQQKAAEVATELDKKVAEIDQKAERATDDALREAAVAYKRIEGFVHRAAEVVGPGRPKAVPPAFAEAMNDDLNTSAALAIVHDTIREGNTALAAGDEAGIRGALTAVRAMLGVLGLDPLDAAWGGGEGGNDLRPVVDGLVALALEQRAQARARKDWAAADQVRDQLKNAGIQVEDTPAGPRWTVGEQH